jgi:RNA polymerase sigma factor (sigma-70 family)
MNGNADENFHSLSDSELIAYCSKQNNALAWQEFVGRFHAQIFRYIVREQRAHSLPNSSDITLDLLQEFYLRLLANDRVILREFRGKLKQSIAAYLACIVHSVVTDFIRHKNSKKRAVVIVSIDSVIDKDSHNRTFAEILPADENTNPEQMYNERLTPQRLRTLLGQVLNGVNGQRDGLIFQLHILNGLTANEIARLPGLQVTEINALAIIRRTREKLRNILETEKLKSIF